MINGNIEKAGLRFWSGNGVVPQCSRWQQTNGVLARLLAGHRRALGQAIAAAEDVRRRIDELAASMAALCRRTCRFCPEPCCITNTVWFDFRDLLFVHLLDEQIPPRQAASNPTEACPFMSHRGCRLPPRIRPWMCTQYLCPTQMAILNQKGRPATAALLDRIERIGVLRIDMEAEVIQRVKRQTRTGPSSSSASPG